jgi:hypothetical protein
LGEVAVVPKIATYEGVGALLDARDSAVELVGLATDLLLESILARGANGSRQALACIEGGIREIVLLDRLVTGAELLQRRNAAEEIASMAEGEGGPL